MTDFCIVFFHNLDFGVVLGHDLFQHLDLSIQLRPSVHIIADLAVVHVDLNALHQGLYLIVQLYYRLHQILLYGRRIPTFVEEFVLVDGYQQLQFLF